MWGIVAGALALAAIFKSKRTVSPALIEAITNTPRTPVKPKTTLVTQDGYAHVEPDAKTWAQQAGLPLDVASLARLIQSEDGTMPLRYKLAVAEAVRNEIRYARVSVYTKLAGSSSYPWSGYFGEQKGRWASTRQDPTAQDVAIAKAVLSGATGNFTNGAHRWFDPKEQDKKKTDALALLDQWYDLEWVGAVEGIDPYRLFLLRKVPKGKKRNIELMRAVIINGRQRFAAVA